MTPVSIRLIRRDPPQPPLLSIRWDDGHEGLHRMQTLRTECPCAGCRHEVQVRDGMITLPILVPGQHELRSIEAVGAYGLQLGWGDEHRTGIYTYEFLRQICECELCHAVDPAIPPGT